MQYYNPDSRVFLEDGATANKEYSGDILKATFTLTPMHWSTIVVVCIYDASQPPSA